MDYSASSIIILAVNQLENLTRPCIESILSTSQGTPLELVLIDNGSTDGTAQYFGDVAQRLGPERVKVHSFPHNMGVTPGRIKGMELATREFIVFLDNDTIATRADWLAELQKPLKDSHLGVTGQTGYYVFVLNDRLTMFFKCPASAGECDVVQGYCMMFRATPFREGRVALDPNYGKLWHEESDLCLQFKQLGYRIAYTDVGVQHKVNSTINVTCGTRDELIQSYVERTAYFSHKWLERGLCTVKRPAPTVAAR